MGELSEQALWFRGKAPITEQFSEQRKAMLDVTASRNLTGIPGQLVRASTDLELKMRQALSNLSYEIVSQAIERELAQQGINYDLEYKNAVILWEIDKANLLDTLTREMADIAKGRADDEHILSALAIEVSLRQIALIAAKLVLELETEAIKKEMAETEGANLPYEVTLAQEKLITAQKKLEIIPHLQALIAEEEALLLVEQINAGYSEDLIDERLAQIPIKEDTLGLKEYLLTMKDSLTAPGLTIAEKKVLLAEARLDYETRARDKVIPTNEMIVAIEALNTATQAYITKKNEIVQPSLDYAIKMNDLLQPTSDYADALLETNPFIVALANKKIELIAPSLAKVTALKTLISPLTKKAKKATDYAEELEDQNKLEVAIKEIAEDIEKLKKTGVEADLAVMQKRLDAKDYEQALIELEVVLKQLDETNRAYLLSHDATDTVIYATRKEEAQANVLVKEKEASTKGLDSGFEVAQIKMKSQFDSVKRTVDTQAGNDGSIEKISRIHSTERTRTASIAAAANITSTLIHQIK